MPTEGPMLTELQALQRQLAARDKTVHVLIQRVEQEDGARLTALDHVRTLHDLEQMYTAKSLELEEERGKLAAALVQLADAKDQQEAGAKAGPDPHIMELRKELDEARSKLNKAQAQLESLKKAPAAPSGPSPEAVALARDMASELALILFESRVLRGLVAQDDEALAPLLKLQHAAEKALDLNLRASGQKPSA